MIYEKAVCNNIVNPTWQPNDPIPLNAL